MKRNLLFLLSLALVIMALSGCILLTEVSGRVVDARSTLSNPGLADVRVTVVADGSSYTTYTNSIGEWSAMVAPGSSYSITYEKSGYYIPSMVTDLESPVTTSSVVPAVRNDTTEKYVYDFVMVWDGSQDLDMYLTFPYNQVFSKGSSTFVTPYDNDYDISGGFGPLGGESQRYIFPGESQSYASGFGDRTYEGVEGIKLETQNLLLSNSSNIVYYGPQNGLDAPPVGEDYEWTGIGNVYVEASASSGNISATNAALYVFYTDVNSNVSLMGVYPAPLSTTTKAASLVRLNFFNLGVQIVPDVNVFPGGSTYFRSVTNTPVFNLR